MTIYLLLKSKGTFGFGLRHLSGINLTDSFAICIGQITNAKLFKEIQPFSADDAKANIL